MTSWSFFITGTLPLLLLLSFNKLTNGFAVDFGDIKDMISLGREITIGALESLDMIQKGSLLNDQPTGDSDINIPFVKKMERRLMNQIIRINDRLDIYQQRMEQNSHEIIDIIIKELPKRNQIDRNINDLSKYLGRIDDFYQKFEEYSRSLKKFESFTIKDFAKTCISSEYGDLPDILLSLHRLIVPNGISTSFGKGIFFQLANNAQEVSAQICNEQQSPQQVLYNLYTTIALTEIKGYAMMQFSYTLLRLYKNGTFDEEINKTFRDYGTRTSETLMAVRTAMAFAPSDLWRCDPQVHEEGKTYEEMKHLFQGYIVNEVDLNSDQSCFKSCGSYEYSKVYGCFDNKYCKQQRKCNGKVLHCQFVDADMWICPSSSNSHRRYEYIEYENGKQFGQKNTCTRPTIKVDSWWRWLFWHCSYCMCYCDEDHPETDRYFNLRDVTSDIANNKVITGIKLVKNNHIVHLQIQEGKLLPRGEIETSSVNWKPVDNFTITGSNVLKNRDYHTLSWGSRAIDMDDLIGTEEQLLTGVRFKLIGAHLNFEIRVTPFNFTSGLLIKPKEMSVWISNDNTDMTHHTNQLGPRTEFDTKELDVSTKTKAPNFPDTKTNQFLHFNPTDLKKDAAQTTIPFIDIQPVFTSPPFPLSGAGIYHKGRSGFGGYIAPKIMTYNFAKHLHVDLPSSPPIIGLNDIPQ